MHLVTVKKSNWIIYDNIKCHLQCIFSYSYALYFDVPII